MPALKRTNYTCKITWLGTRPENPTDPDGIRSVAQDNLELDFEGAKGESHSGPTRSACARVRHIYKEGTEIRNTRQLSVVSAEEIAAISEKLGIDGIAPEWLGATIVVEGIPNFSRIPPSSRLISDDGVAMIVDMENQPCVWPAREIEAEHPGHGMDFSRAAQGMRGVTTCVERPGSLKIGEMLTLYIPSQPPWSES